MVNVSDSGEALVRPGAGEPAVASGRPRRVLAATGDPSDPSVMSGLPYHFFLYGRRYGLVDSGVTRNLPPWQLKMRRAAWNGWRAATLRGYRGHQYTSRRNESLWPSLPDPDTVVINIFQLYPRHVLEAPARRWFFIDQTLRQLFDFYGQGDQLPRDVMERALEWERRGYESAEFIITNSQWARNSIVEDYQVEPGRVGVVLQAANVDPVVYEDWAQAHQPRTVADGGTLRLVFVGNDWHRKGLDRLIAAVAAVNGRQRRVSVDVLGLTRKQVPPSLRDVPHVTWHGFVNKQTDQRRFLELLAAADIGCLLSRAEAGGNSLREYHAVGLAVLGTGAGGAGEQTLPDASWLVGTGEQVADIAERLSALLADPAQVQARKDASWRQRASVLWPATLRDVSSLLAARGA